MEKRLILLTAIIMECHKDNSIASASRWARAQRLREEIKLKIV